MKLEDIKDGDRISVKDFNELFPGGKGSGKSRKSSTRNFEVKSSSGKASSSDVNGGSSKKSKFGAIATYVDGIRFDSKWEAKRYAELKISLKAKEISDLKLQVPYEIIINDILVTKYVADFVYLKDGVEIVEDAKGFETPEYKIKRSLMMAVHGIEIFETREKKKSYRRRR